MPGRTGRMFATIALREINVIDPETNATGQRLADALEAATDLLDTWRTQRLTIGGVTITDYNLVSGTQTYTIGPGATWDQAYPASILSWSVIPDGGATDPLEIAMGPPASVEGWQGIGLKSGSGRPRVLFLDDTYDANGRGVVHFFPKPDDSAADVRLYQALPTLTSLAADTVYVLRPGGQRAFTLALALELKDRYGKGATATDRLIKRADDALASYKRANIRPKAGRIRGDFVIGRRHARNFNVYSGS